LSGPPRSSMTIFSFRRPMPTISSTNGHHRYLLPLICLYSEVDWHSLAAQFDRRHHNLIPWSGSILCSVSSSFCYWLKQTREFLPETNLCAILCSWLAAAFFNSSSFLCYDSGYAIPRASRTSGVGNSSVQYLYIFSCNLFPVVSVCLNTYKSSLVYLFLNLLTCKVYR
jgi:hypothetical protein